MTNPNREYWEEWDRKRRETRSTPTSKAGSIMNLFAVIGFLLIISISIPLLTLLVSMGLFVVFGVAIFSFIVIAIRHIIKGN